MINVSLAFSREKDPFVAGKEAAEEALEDVRKPDIALVFVSGSYDIKQVWKGLKSALDCDIIGCSTAGEILNEPKFGTVSLALISTDYIRFFTTSEGRCPDYEYLGRSLTENLIKESGVKTLGYYIRRESGRTLLLAFHAFLFLVCGIGGSGSEFARGVREVIRGYPLVFGGSAGDDLKFEKTWVFDKWKLHSDGAVGCILDTKLPVGVGVGHGWTPISPPFVVTKSQGNKLLELDGKPAVEVYSEVLGEKIAEKLVKEPLGKAALVYPLGIIDIHGRYRLRHPIRALEDGSIICSGDVPMGHVVRIMSTDEGKMIDAAKSAARQALESIGEPNPEDIGLAIIPDCAARMAIFGENKCKKEIEAVKEVIGDVPIVGFYTYGEYSSLGGGVEYLNETIVVGIISRRSLLL